MMLMLPCEEAGGSDEFQGNVDYTFTRADGTELGTQGEYSFYDVIPGIRDTVHSQNYSDGLGAMN
jgi:hypothetical protein